jgi:preprotein translocase subunit SecE
VARQTRAQRRARREQQEASGNAGLQQRARTRQQQIRPTQAVKTQTGARRLPGAGGGGRRFVSESWGELRKVEWPNQSQVVQGTVVVLIACLIVGVYLYVADEVFKRLVENVFLR